MKLTKEMIEELLKNLKQEKSQLWDVYMNPDDRRRFFSESVTPPETSFHIGTNIIESEFIEPGRVYKVRRPALDIKFAEPPAVIDQSLLDSLRYRIASAFGLPRHLFGDYPEKVRFRRRLRNESLIQWGKYLDKHDLLDDPENRRQYSNEVFKALTYPIRLGFSKVSRVFRRRA